MTAPELTAAHGGILFPLDPVRVTMIAAAVGETFIARARNILDAKLTLTRHPEAPLLLMRITGSVVDTDEASFWRENADIGVMLSQVLPRQVFVYWVTEDPRREGFLIAQGGQGLAGDEVDDESMPPDARPEDWPVAKLAEQLRLTIDELKAGFAPGPSIELPLVDVTGDDRELLEILAGAPPGAEGGAGPEEHEQGGPQPGPGSDSGAASATDPGRPKAPSAADDAKRRAKEREQEREERARAAAAARSGLRVDVDELGAVVAPRVELGDTDILGSYVNRRVAGDLPEGLDRSLTDRLQGLRIDFVVRVDFFSEVFYSDSPLSRPAFAEHGTERTMAGESVHALGVHAPRLGAGTLVRGENSMVFVSREPDTALPEALIVELLAAEA